MSFINRGGIMGQNTWSDSPAPLSIMDMISRNNLLTSLAIVLDAGDQDSYDGTSQTWVDASGNAQNFYLGLTSGATTTDPTFSGTAGRKSYNEYFSNDGTDSFTETSTSVNFAETWHKNNAVFTFGAVMYANDTMDQPSPPPGTAIFQNCQTGGTIGDAGVYIGSVNNDLKLGVFTPTTSPLNVILKTSWLPVTASFIACIISMDEPNGNILIKTSSAAATLSTGNAYVSPSSSASVQKYSIMADSDGQNGWKNGTRMASLFAWNRTLTSAELDLMWASLRTRWPLT